MLRKRLACALAAGIIYLATPSIASAVPIQWAGNGHYYDLIPTLASWQQALTAAGGMTIDPDGPGGNDPLQGYLVTITSAGEQAFLDANYQVGYWVAGTDEGSEGVWRWAAGPESGQIFWNLGVVPGMYSNWNAGEPNNLGGEHYLQDNLFPNGSNWNDWCSGAACPGNLINFVVEYSPRSAVPEPASMLLVATGIGGLIMRRRRAARS